MKNSSNNTFVEIGLQVFFFLNVFIWIGFLRQSIPFLKYIIHNTIYSTLNAFCHKTQPNGHNTVLTGNIYSFCLCSHSTSIACFTFVVSSIISVNACEFQYVPMCGLIIADLDPCNIWLRIPSCQTTQGVCITFKHIAWRVDYSDLGCNI